MNIKNKNNPRTSRDSSNIELMINSKLNLLK